MVRNYTIKVSINDQEVFSGDIVAFLKSNIDNKDELMEKMEALHCCKTIMFCERMENWKIERVS